MDPEVLDEHLTVPSAWNTRAWSVRDERRRRGCTRCSRRPASDGELGVDGEHQHPCGRLRLDHRHAGHSLHRAATHLVGRSAAQQPAVPVPAGWGRPAAVSGPAWSADAHRDVGHGPRSRPPTGRGRRRDRGARAGQYLEDISRSSSVMRSPGCRAGVQDASNLMMRWCPMLTHVAVDGAAARRRCGPR